MLSRRLLVLGLTTDQTKEVQASFAVRCEVIFCGNKSTHLLEIQYSINLPYNLSLYKNYKLQSEIMHIKGDIFTITNFNIGVRVITIQTLL